MCGSFGLCGIVCSMNLRFDVAAMLCHGSYFHNDDEVKLGLVQRS